MQTNTPPPSFRVIEAVARSAGVDETALPALTDHIDPEALDALFAPRADGTPRTGIGPRVSFTYADHHVLVRPSGDVDVHGPLADEVEYTSVPRDWATDP